MTSKPVRCAVYTRKSSEEGLEQAFNSLEAQREACCAYVLSQKHEGWTVLNDRYDDRGFSGGSMERPALEQLLADIKARKVDTVVVYKVDRLTRSLMDFSKIIEVFDSHSVSFVSVTQQFNTTTSMGRLTLNVLLSFAQFEREVTGERIRDKVAASKKKGMWMGGTVPVGYDWTNRSLTINEPEAETIREIFGQYARSGSVKQLQDDLALKQIRSKRRMSITGRSSGGARYSRGALYKILKNRLYVGEIVHRGQPYPGQHEAIVSRELWDQVAARLHANNQAHRAKGSKTTTSLLSGIIFDTSGVRFTPTHSLKKGKRYRYYTSQAAIQQTGNIPAVARFPAQELENIVTARIHNLLASPKECFGGLKISPENDAAAQKAAHMAKRWGGLDISVRYGFVRNVVRRVIIGQSAVWIEVDRRTLIETLLGRRAQGGFDVSRNEDQLIKLTADFQPLHSRGELRLSGSKEACIEETSARSLVKAIARARDWCERIVAGEVNTIGQLARQTGLPISYVKRILRCGRLSPQMTDAVLSGRHRPNLVLEQITRRVPVDWQEQSRVLRGPQG